MLTLRIEGPRNEVNAFIRDIKNDPQYNVIAQSMPYMEDIIDSNNVVSYCQFRYTHLSEIGKPLNIKLDTDGDELDFFLDYGKVIRVGNIIQVVGKVTNFLPKIASEEKGMQDVGNQ
ncbi:hypothetical protein [Lihuaxuella thermophila]|uniref:Uncharacterized protein n=1 Tax=Lihuaxuella thermophila TaxID=1173111 RepID=A0A1H8AXJ9_9BACL|nr:hypothetical protein [Lihuaxuella thermophila]SEM74569.1 hypothetical protein SAMN05444955_101370 [Lihuaxuella thermophila]